MQDDIRIVPARESHLVHLPDVERAAGKLFIGWGLPDALFEQSTPLEDFREARAEGVLWVAVRDDDHPIGFALGEVLAASLHLEELDVHPDYGRQGVGAALVAALIRRADELELPVTLTTFRDIPWNAPYYTKLGFRELRDAELGNELREIVRDETEGGLEAERRVVMQRDPA